MTKNQKRDSLKKDLVLKNDLGQFLTKNDLGT